MICCSYFSHIFCVRYADNNAENEKACAQNNGEIEDLI